MVGDLEIRTTIPIFAQRNYTRQTSHERQNSVRGFLLCVRCAFDNFRLSRRLIISYLYCLSFNPDGIMLWKAGYGHCRSRWHYASRVIISLGGRGDNRVQVCDGLAPAQSCTPLFLYKCAGICARANGAEGVRESVAGLPGHSLTAKGGNRGCWSGCLCCSSAEAQTDRRASTAFLIGPGRALPLVSGTIGPD